MREIAVHLAVAGSVCDGVFLCCPFFLRDVLDEILDLIESFSGGFPTYSLLYMINLMISNSNSNPWLVSLSRINSGS